MTHSKKFVLLILALIAVISILIVIIYLSNDDSPSDPQTISHSSVVIPDIPENDKEVDNFESAQGELHIPIQNDKANTVPDLLVPDKECSQ